MDKNKKRYKNYVNLKEEKRKTKKVPNAQQQIFIIQEKNVLINTKKAKKSKLRKKTRKYSKK